MASSEKNPAIIDFAKSLNHVPWCDDYEKMISGVMYYAGAPELFAGKIRTRKLMQEYNNNSLVGDNIESVMESRHKILKDLLGNVGERVYIETPFAVDYGCNISIGDACFANFNLVILDCGLVTIGNRVAIGPSVSIITATHGTDIQPRRELKGYAKGITIGDDCWIGANVVILPGVTIGKGCTIGAGSVVTKDIPDYSVAMGSPARVTRKIDLAPEL